MINTLFAPIRQWMYRWFAPSSEAPLQGKYYVRTGGCNGCGKCCSDIYLVHEELPIQTEEEFRRAQAADDEFHHFNIIDRDEHGLVFQCRHLKEDNSCAIYDDRPLFCRQYPGERSIILGAQLPKECGYQFHLLKTFQEVLAECYPGDALPHVEPYIAEAGSSVVSTPQPGDVQMPRTA